MTDREKVVNGLRQCVGYEDVDNNYTCIYDGDTNPNCPYGGTGGDGVSCMTKMMRDALALLKAQEPRLMTLEEILSSDGAVWILDHDDKGCEIHIAFPLRKRGELDPVIEFRSKEPDMLEHRLIRDYLVGWCCWTFCPTDEQREATPWG